MKKFENPEIEVIEIQDVVATGGNDTPGDDLSGGI